MRFRLWEVSTRTSSRQAGCWMEFSWWVKWVTPAPSILLVCRSLLTQITQNEPKGKIQKQIRLETMLLCCYRVNRALRRSLLHLKSSKTSTSCAFINKERHSWKYFSWNCIVIIIFEEISFVSRVTNWNETKKLQSLIQTQNYPWQHNAFNSTFIILCKQCIFWYLMQPFVNIISNFE